MIAFEAVSTQPGGIRRNLATLFVCTEAGMPVDAELGCLEAQLHRSSVVTEHIARLSERTIDPTRSRKASLSEARASISASVAPRALACPNESSGILTPWIDVADIVVTRLSVKGLSTNISRVVPTYNHCHALERTLCITHLSDHLWITSVRCVSRMLVP